MGKLEITAAVLGAWVLSVACSKTGDSSPVSSRASASSSANAAVPADLSTPPPDAQTSPSGLVSKVITRPTGTKNARIQDAVRINYSGWSSDGKLFGSSDTLGRAARVGVEGTIPGLREVLQLMAEGEKRRVWIPEQLVGKGWPDPPPGKLVFDIEVIEIIPGTATVAAPSDVAGPPSDVQKTRSGLCSKVLTQGSGKKHPRASDTVKVHYSGWTTDGRLFDSSVTKGQPAAFPLEAVIAGWTEGVQLMVEGEKRRFWIPQELAYKGMEGHPKGMLVFDIELLEILVAPKAPPDVAAAPSDAQKTASGLASKVLQPGTGKRHPTATSRVSAHYTGWTTNGKVFDSSVTRGQAGTFGLADVIAGWTEGLQLMVEGEKRRFWIPEKLAYQGRRGKPKGMLVFDVELVSILDL